MHYIMTLNLNLSFSLIVVFHHYLLIDSGSVFNNFAKKKQDGNLCPAHEISKP